MHVSRTFAMPSDQNDLMQELMVSAWKARPAFRGDSDIRTFLFRVARNRAIRWKRCADRRAFYSQHISREIEEKVPAPTAHDGEAKLNILYAAIRRLAPLDKSLVLASLESLPYADIATLHHLTESNVGARLTRARTRLTTMVAEMADGL